MVRMVMAGAGQAHRQKREAIAGHIEGAVVTTSIDGLVRAFPKIGGCFRDRGNDAVDVP